MTDDTGRRVCGVKGGHVAFALCVVVMCAIVGGAIWSVVVDERSMSHVPTYSMAITGVAGLDLNDVASDSHPTLSPVFNLTLRITNPQDEYREWVPELSIASVFYGDAFLGKGSVEPFCAEPKREREGRARAWGQDVAMPRFLRDQLAGELQRGDAAVDVEVKMPSGCNMMACFDTVFLCRAKIRVGSPCFMSSRLVEGQH